MFYFCSLGSNIAPEKNVIRALSLLLEHLPELTLSPVVATEPHGMQSRQTFYNALFWFECPLPPDAVKTMFNDIETGLGRNRADPLKKVSDRPMDLDILYAGAPCALSSLQVDDPYLAPLVPVLHGQPPGLPVITLQMGGVTLGGNIVSLSAGASGQGGARQ